MERVSEARTTAECQAERGDELPGALSVPEGYRTDEFRKALRTLSRSVLFRLAQRANELRPCHGAEISRLAMGLCPIDGGLNRVPS
jgi:hypothetical protein